MKMLRAICNVSILEKPTASYLRLLADDLNALAMMKRGRAAGRPQSSRHRHATGLTPPSMILCARIAHIVLRIGFAMSVTPYITPYMTLIARATPPMPLNAADDNVVYQCQPASDAMRADILATARKHARRRHHREARPHKTCRYQAAGRHRNIAAGARLAKMFWSTVGRRRWAGRPPRRCHCRRCWLHNADAKMCRKSTRHAQISAGLPRRLIYINISAYHAHETFSRAKPEYHLILLYSHAAIKHESRPRRATAMPREP